MNRTEKAKSDFIRQTRWAREDLIHRFARLSPDEKLDRSLMLCSLYLERHRLPRLKTPLTFRIFADYARWKRRQRHPIFR